jgi:glycosidase
MEYRIADDLGGDEAYRNLRHRCAQRGIRLSSDMVPNHMGIDSRWVIEHPDWFLGMSDPPYPSYSFTGGNLADDERVMVQIEDHYWSNTDAAVVFKRTDMLTGDVRYIYHGNDGTSMPWNDTAQLDYLNPEVREAVIQTILHVARQFPIIRFDAAMTLARRHIQRLWFPEPGQGGAIPSRAEHAVPKAVFDERMPNEFWREVVDRVALEAPDTLLLAEAFWLLEGYFVRTLGMHRVYNSAFMNMLRDEDNASYRKVIKDTIEFDPEVLKRYVNFMSNPDERTAIDQFGKGDKYFGVCTVMATMPGLPMIGHGQIEGFAEKYGMEYRKAYRDESPDGWLIERHEREIFPLFHRRYLFAGVTDFLLYDVYDPEGWVNEDVFAYSNRAGDERSLVIYHNKYAEARGWIKTSAAYSVSDGGGRRLVQRSLGEGLGLHPDGNWFTLLREQRSGLQFIRPSSDLCRDGLYVELQAYGCQVFLDVHEVEDVDGRWARLADRLGGAGVASVDSAMREMELEPVHSAVRGLVEGGAVLRLTDLGAARARAACPGAAAAGVDLGLHGPVRNAAATGPEAGEVAETEVDGLLDEVVERVGRALRAAADSTGTRSDVEAIAATFRQRLEAALALPETRDKDLCAGLADSWTWVALFGRLISEALVAAVELRPDDAKPAGGPERKPAGSGTAAAFTIGQASAATPVFDSLELAPVLAGVFRDLGLDDGAAWRLVGLNRMLRTLPLPSSVASLRPAERAAAMVRALLARDAVRAYLGVNVWEDVTWFNRESFDHVLWWMFALETLAAEDRDPKRLTDAKKLTKALSKAAERSGYQLDKLEAAAAER